MSLAQIVWNELHNEHAYIRISNNNSNDFTPACTANYNSVHCFSGAA